MNNAEEFLSFVAKNEKRLKRNLKKNITYDESIFDDVFQTTVVKIYDSIVKNDKMVDNFEQYFFISSKFEYILHDNRNKKKKNITDNIDDIRENLCDESFNENEAREIGDLLSQLKKYLIENYGETNTNIILDYFQMKSEGICSYKKIADEYNLPTKIVCSLIQKCKEDENIKNFYKKYKTIKAE